MAEIGPFTIYRLSTSLTPAFKALSVHAKALYPQVRLEWRPGPINNNGSIRYSVTQAAEFLGCSRETARKALADMQRKGFLRIKEIAKLGSSGMARGHCYEITEEVMPGASVPSRLFLEWKPDKEFEVRKARANNPAGRNGKSKTPTSEVGCPNIDGKFNDAIPNINRELKPNNARPKRRIPNLPVRSSLDSLKGNPPSNLNAACLSVASGFGLCGRAALM